jgi:hypothetical protein
VHCQSLTKLESQHWTGIVEIPASQSFQEQLPQSLAKNHLGLPLVLRSGYERRGCPQAVSRRSHRTRNKNKQTNLNRTEPFTTSSQLALVPSTESRRSTSTAARYCRDPSTRIVTNSGAPHAVRGATSYALLVSRRTSGLRVVPDLYKPKPIEDC